MDENDVGQTDLSESDESDSEDNDSRTYSPGDIVWGKYGRFWYPAVIVSLTDVPEQFRKKFSRVEDNFILKWFGEDRFSAVKIHSIMNE